MTTQDVPSPCIGVCRLDANGAYCCGCGRHIDEIGRWSNMDPVERQRVVDRLRRRRSDNTDAATDALPRRRY
ncbi:DUF1289 domain-containing protein [Arhodomonas sp. AD133]|uniref:DUF1289 domain-containing protein n=1 Tax=Arhodomonas sp. AD133 TaxID=3415009 RepID=UPI003EB76BB3